MAVEEVSEYELEGDGDEEDEGRANAEGGKDHQHHRPQELDRQVAALLQLRLREPSLWWVGGRNG